MSTLTMTSTVMPMTHLAQSGMPQTPSGVLFPETIRANPRERNGDALRQLEFRPVLAPSG